MLVLRYLFLVLNSMAVYNNSYSQTIEKSVFSMEIDPISTVLGAKTIWGMYHSKSKANYVFGLNLFTSDFSNKVDDLLNPKNVDKGFETKVKVGGGMSMDYFFAKNHEGYYIGIANLLFNNEVELASEAQTFLTHNVVPRVGYRWYPFPKLWLYLNPFLGLRFEYAFKTIQFEQDEFRAAGLQPFGSVHVGYRF